MIELGLGPGFLQIIRMLRSLLGCRYIGNVLGGLRRLLMSPDHYLGNTGLHR